jgi:hypothetical protein
MGVPGLILNVINFIVFFRGNFSKNMKFYYSIQSIYDPLNIINWLFTTFPTSLGTDFATHSDFLCKFLFTSRRILAQNSAWLQAMTSIDRVFFTFFNAKYKQMIGPKYLWGSVALIAIFVGSTSMVNLNFYLNVNETIINNRTIIQRRCTVNREIGFIINVSGFLMRAILPFLIMLISNLILIYKLFLHKSNMNKLSKKEYNFAFSIVSNNFAYLLLNLPLTGQQLFEYLPVVNTPEDRAFMNFLLFIGTICCNIYWAYTFLIYLKFNKTYRKELFKMKKGIFNETISTSTSVVVTKRQSQKIY